MGKKTKVKRIPGKVVVWSGKAAGRGWAYRIEGGPLDGFRSENKYRSRAMAVGAGRAFKVKSLVDFGGDLVALTDRATADKWINGRIKELGGRGDGGWVELQAIAEYKTRNNK